MTNNELESLEINFFVDYKKIKEPKTEWLHGPIHHSSKNLTTWLLQIDNSHPTSIGIYVTLLHGAPCQLHSYNINMWTNRKPALRIFINRCTFQRTFPTEPFSWGFENFCSRRELKDHRKLIRDRKTNLIHVQCTMSILHPSLNDIFMDQRFATDLFQTRPLDEWVEFLKHRCDLPMLENRVNRELERRLTQFPS